jgi:hypothetical protein
LAEQVYLTSEIVNATVPPERGERWIADTAVQGFGLRLWATRSGEGKAFAIRVSSTDGKIVRKTFDPRNSCEYRLARLVGGCSPTQLGSYLTGARQWGSEEIIHLKGRITYREKIQIGRVRAAEKELRRTLQEVADDLLRDMRRRKLSDTYIDRLDKLFAVHIPIMIRSAPLAEQSTAEIAAALGNANLPPSALQLLRPFLGRVFEKAAPARTEFFYFSRKLNDHLRQLRGNRDSSGMTFPELENFTEEDYRRIFQRLESETRYWQQAMCARLFFEFWAPFYRLMSARWDSIVDRRWYPFPRSEWRLNARYGGRIDDEISLLLDQVRSLGTEKFGPTPYWFPSPFGRKFGYIRTVDTIWRNILHDLQAPYMPLRDVALHYKNSPFRWRSVCDRICREQQTKRMNDAQSADLQRSL